MMKSLLNHHSKFSGRITHKSGFRFLQCTHSSGKPSKSLLSGSTSIARASSSTTPTTKTTTPTIPTHIDAAEVARQSGVRLTEPELQLLRKKLGDGSALSMEQFNKAGREALEKQWARELCLAAVEQPTTYMDRVGSRLITALDYGGKALFAVVGTQVAGDAGMNVVGCTLVGCISCMGGGTLNNLLYGNSTLLKSTGVSWVRNPSSLYLAVGASVVTFFLWPIYCREQAKKELEDVFGKENLDKDGGVIRETFIKACERDEEFRSSVIGALGNDAIDADLSTLFDLVDSDGSGAIDLDEMQFLVGKRFNSSPIIFMLDTLALGALGIAGVHGAISRGVASFVACTSGITMCFGGVLRDVLCGRDLALGGASLALATGLGSTMYVFLRELSLRSGVHISLVSRIVLSVGSTVAIRAFEFYRGESLLKPMHHYVPPNEINDNNINNKETTATTVEASKKKKEENSKKVSTTTSPPQVLVSKRPTLNTTLRREPRRTNYQLKRRKSTSYRLPPRRSTSDRVHQPFACTDSANRPVNTTNSFMSQRSSSGERRYD